MLWQRIRHGLEYLLVRVAISLVQAVSIETCAAVARLAGFLLYDVVRLRRSITDENLANALPERSPAERAQIARDMWEHLILMVCEIAHAPRKIHDSNYRKYIHLENKRQLVTGMLSPRPKVTVTAHLGNFEIAGYSGGMLGFTTFTVARTLDNPLLDRFLNEFRELKGQFILPKSGSAPQADAVLNTGGNLVLLGDQHAGSRGVNVDFMGRPASCHKALALFSLLNRAPMLVVYCTRRGKPLQFEFGLADSADPLAPGFELADVKSMTQWYNRVLENEIRKAPHQYWWLHRRWRDATPKRRKKPSQPAPQAESQRPAA